MKQLNSLLPSLNIFLHCDGQSRLGEREDHDRDFGRIFEFEDLLHFFFKKKFKQ